VIAPASSTTYSSSVAITCWTAGASFAGRTSRARPAGLPAPASFPTKPRSNRGAQFDRSGSRSFSLPATLSAAGMAGSVGWLRAGDEEAGPLSGAVGLGVARPGAGEPQARSAEHALPLVERVDVVAERPDRAASTRADERPFARPAAGAPIKLHLLERQRSVGRAVPPPAGEPCVADAIAVVDEDPAARLQRAGHAAQDVEVRARREVAERGVQVEHGVELP